MNCTGQTNSLINFSLNASLHVFILFTFLTVFFIVYISKIEKDAFESQIKNTIDSNVKTYIGNLDATTKSRVKIIINSPIIEILEERFKRPDPSITEHNWWVEHLSIGIIIVIGLIILTGISTLYFGVGQCAPVLEILKENIIIFIFVGFIEYIFFINVALKYIPAPPSLLVKTIIDTAKTQLSA